MVESVTNLNLVVPEQPSHRKILMDTAHQVVARSGLLPPVSLDTLENLAQTVLKQIHGSADDLAFAIILCSNELWRPYFEATAFNRRLLLLPQCLRSSSSCTATIDDLGLICEGCNLCPIHSLLSKAESLGYETLVAEGSSTAIALVEEGSVDAILGVSCLEVLQKSFRQVFSSAIPSIAIPLLKNGCSDTKIDQQWLSQEIQKIHLNPGIEPLSVSTLKTQAETLFTRDFLCEQMQPTDQPGSTGQLAVQSMLQGGKRMRPLLTLITYTAYAQQFSQKIADQLMLITECFHKASLIHDDIEDGDDFRYNKKTVHHEYGIPIATNLGDYLIGIGYRKLSLLPISDNRKLQLFDLFTTMHIESTIGQGDELSVVGNQAVHGMSQILKIFSQKTSSAIKVSLLAGAIAAEAPMTDQQILSEFAELFGIAYQIRDDLSEFRRTAEDQQNASFPFLKSMLVEKHPILAENQFEWRKEILRLRIDQEADEKLKATLAFMGPKLEQLGSQKSRLALLNIVNRYFDLA